MKKLTTLNVEYKLLNFNVGVYPIRDTSQSISFNGLSDCCDSEVGLKKYCKKCGKEHGWNTKKKGFKLSKNEMIPLTQEEIDSIETYENGIKIEYFVDAQEVDGVYFDKPYVLESVTGHKVYNAIKDILSLNNLMAVCRYVSKGNEHKAVLRAYRGLLVIQQIERVKEADISLNKAVCSNEEINIISDIIKADVKPFDSNFTIDYIEKVMALIEKKANGESIVITEKPKQDKELSMDVLLMMKKQAEEQKKQVVSNDSH